MAPFVPTYHDIRRAHTVISPWLHHTPVLTCRSIDGLTNAHLYFKCENLQKSGSFKIRGATFAVQSLSDSEADRGVATHSSGNHGAALALAAKSRTIPAYVVIPENAPEIKKRAVAGYGADITYCEPNLQAREQTISNIISATGAIEIHPYDNYNVIAGQGTVAKELLEDEQGFDMILAPVGGGGLLAGSALTIKQICPETRVIGCEPQGADDAYRSFMEGRIIPSVSPLTIADGLLTSLGKRNFDIITKHVDEIVTVSETAIIAAMKMIGERMKIVIEPSAAVPLAAILQKRIEVQNKKIGIIISGGNLDLAKLPFK